MEIDSRTWNDIWIKNKGKEIYKGKTINKYVRSGAKRTVLIKLYKKQYWIFRDGFYVKISDFIKYCKEEQKKVPIKLMNKLEEQAVLERL